MNPRIVWAHVAMFSAALIYAINFTVAKWVMPLYLSPSAFIVLRVVFAAALFWIVQALFIRQPVARRHWGLMLVCSLCGVATNQLLFFKGLELTTPIQGALMMLTTPILVTLLYTVVAREPLNVRRVAGIALGLSGAAWLISQRGGADHLSAPRPALGNLLILLNALSYGTYLVLVKPLLRHYHPLTVSAWTFGIAIPIVTPFGWSGLQAAQWHTFPAYIWATIGFVLLFVTFFTYLFNALALRVVSPAVVGAYIYLQPLLTTLIAVGVGSDHLRWSTVVASALIFVGVALVSRPTRTAADTQVPPPPGASHNTR